MSKIPVNHFFDKVTAESINQAAEIVTDEQNFDFFKFMSSYINSLKKRGLTFVDIENQQHQELFLYAFCAGVALEVERQKTPVSKYLKDCGHIFVEFEVDGQRQRANVPSHFTNKQIKKILSEATGKPFKGNFKKVSEFEQKQILKELERVGV